MNDPNVQQQADYQAMQGSGPHLPGERTSQSQGVAHSKKIRIDSVWHYHTTFWPI
jgi:hypothetical protein